MKKWQEISLNGVMNFAIALTIAGIVAIVIQNDDNNKIGSIALFCYGVLLWVYALYRAKKLDGD